MSSRPLWATPQDEGPGREAGARRKKRQQGEKREGERGEKEGTGKKKQELNK